ncbi:hypothetical protein PVK06_008485 [Gossypium arboreum]|uniref:RNase H type-1 domain-containing protein n=1 Tax=Gossypium arboreum TaxID=29729 RepID=A0ABR0QKE4_GOSAR|nr:hypothetical protein PVK06_008485 [Gossypium arboreum]
MRLELLASVISPFTCIYSCLYQHRKQISISDQKIHFLLSFSSLSILSFYYFRSSITKKWEKPPKGSIKINFDITVNGNRMGYGVVIRDDEGFLLRGGGGFIDGRISVQEAECIALERSIKVAGQLNIHGDVLFETDNAGLVNKMNKCDMDITIIGARIKACKDAFNLFKSANLASLKRLCNNVADFICTKICSEAKMWFFYMDYPKEIHNVVINDVT